MNFEDYRSGMKTAFYQSVPIVGRMEILDRRRDIRRVPFRDQRPGEVTMKFPIVGHNKFYEAGLVDGRETGLLDEFRNHIYDKEETLDDRLVRRIADNEIEKHDGIYLEQQDSKESR